MHFVITDVSCSAEVNLLNAAKVAAMKDMPSFAKMDRNNQGKYDYTSFNQFMRHVRDHLLTHELTLTPITKEMISEEENNGTVWLRIDWKLTHSSGQWEIAPIVSMANNKDKGDKHVAKAYSYNIKDLLRSMFFIPSGDDDPDDDDSKEDLRGQLDKLKTAAAVATSKANKAYALLTEEQKQQLRGV